jgi:3-deoxy-manno-octulosonate cytidylyltransferase (CMP-KDO synthetase)
MRDFLGVIPARFKSSRFPGKPLVDILGLPMIIRVAQQTEKALGKDGFVVATDDNRIAEVVEKYGYQFIMTGDQHPTGTDRIWEVAQKIESKIYINIQGDEPIIDPEDILKILRKKEEFPDSIVNGYAPLNENEDPHSLNIPKVAISKSGRLMYMSRLAIPGIKSSTNVHPNYLKQVSVYAFNRNELEAFGMHKGKSECESFEDIEIVRFLELDFPVQMVELSGNTVAVDVEDDVKMVEQYLMKKSNHV